MKKTVALLACALSLLLPAATLAETTEPLEAPGEPLGVTLTLPEELMPFAYRLTDDYLVSRISLQMGESVSIEPQKPAQSLVLNWYDVPVSYTVSQLDASGATLSEETITDRELGKQIALDSACKKINVLFNENGSLGGVVAYPAGASLPEGGLSFEPTPAQADLLIISAEPGMEFRQFGAVLPGYTREKGVSTAMMYISDYGKRVRAYEALNGLQTAGYENYPIFCGYESDDYSSYKYTASKFDRRAFVEFLKEQIKAINPKLIVTHGMADPSGAHSLVAECVQIAVVECPSVQKLYCFGTAEGKTPTVLDLNAPLNAYDGKTAAEVSQSAYDQHASQRIYGLKIDTSSAYTLAYSTVGEDVAKNDLLEHIDTTTLMSYAVATPSPAPLPEATATPEIMQATQNAQQPPPTQLASELGANEGFPTLPVAIVLGAGIALSALLFALRYKRLLKTRGKGDAICLCLMPFALCFAASAVIAGTKIESRIPAQQVEAAIQATPLATQTPLPSETPAQTTKPEVEEATQTPEAQQADPDAQYYRAAGEPEEVIVADKENGRWEYRSDALGIQIDRVSATNSAGKPLTYFVADIHMRDISQFRPAFGAEGHTGRGAIHPWIIARREKAVLWMTGDNLVNDEREQKGILIRDGRMFWSGEKEDTLAIYPDMSMRIIKKNAMSPGMLLEDGVENAYSFGPTLIDNGIINEQAKFHRVRRANPRAGIGYLSPGHYIAIVVDGRQKDYSVGMPVWEFADLFASYGCSIAYNLDGGLSAAMIFMGEQINTHSGKRTGASNDISYQRAVPDGMMFGYSEQVPSVDAPVLNDGNHGK